MRLLLFLIAVGIVVFGVVSASLLWVLIGACAIALLRYEQGGVALDGEIQRFVKLVKRLLGPMWRQLVLAACVCIAIAGWTTNKSAFSLLGVVCWLVAIGLLVGAGFVHDRSMRNKQPVSPPPADPNDVGQWRWTRVDWGAAIVLTLLAFGLRIYQLGTYLPPVHGDEGEMGMLALLALHGPGAGLGDQPLLPFGTAFLGHPTLFHYLQAFGMLIFGESVTGLRVVSVIFGALCAPLLYAIGRVNWGRIAGFTAGWLLAVSHLHIQFSRIALNNIETVFSIILLIWLFTLVDSSTRRHLVRTGQDEYPIREAPLLLYIVIGLVIGLGQYFYFGSRLLPLVAVILLLGLGRKQQITWQQILLVGIAAVVAYFPLLVHYLTHWQAFSDRVSGVGVLSPSGMAHALGPQATWPNDIPRLLWTQIQLTLGLFLNYGDHSAFYLADIPAFDKITVALFWLGLGLVFAKAKRFRELMLLAWFGLGVLLGGVLTNDAPNGPRLIVAVPAIFLIGGLFLQTVCDTLARSWSNGGRWNGNALVLAVAIGTLYLNFNTYFIEYKQRQPNTTQLEIAQEMAANADAYSFYLLGAPNLYVDYGTIRFIARAADRHDLEDAAQLRTALDQLPADKGALIIVLPHRINDLAEIEKQFPHGTKTTHKDKHDILHYVTYRIDVTDIPQTARH